MPHQARGSTSTASALDTGRNACGCVLFTQVRRFRHISAAVAQRLRQGGGKHSATQLHLAPHREVMYVRSSAVDCIRVMCGLQHTGEESKVRCRRNTCSTPGRDPMPAQRSRAMRIRVFTQMGDNHAFTPCRWQPDGRCSHAHWHIQNRLLTTVAVCRPGPSRRGRQPWGRGGR